MRINYTNLQSAFVVAYGVEVVQVKLNDWRKPQPGYVDQKRAENAGTSI